MTSSASVCRGQVVRMYSTSPKSGAYRPALLSGNKSVTYNISDIGISDIGAAPCCDPCWQDTLSRILSLYPMLSHQTDVCTTLTSPWFYDACSSKFTGKLLRIYSM